MWLPLAAIPGSLGLLMGMLLLSQVIEQRVLSPQAMIRTAVRARSTKPEYAEVFVASQLERLLREVQKR